MVRQAARRADRSGSSKEPSKDALYFLYKYVVRVGAGLLSSGEGTAGRSSARARRAREDLVHDRQNKHDHDDVVKTLMTLTHRRG